MENFVQSAALPESRQEDVKPTNPSGLGNPPNSGSNIMNKQPSGAPPPPAGPPSLAPDAISVLTERNATLSIKSNPNMMMSPVLFKLRRNQEKKVQPANPVDPVQVPPKKFTSFQADSRYMSPTDSLMSPISRGLLARGRRAMRPPPAYVPPKTLESTFQDVDVASSGSS